MSGMSTQDVSGGQAQHTDDTAPLATDLRHVVIEGDDILAARVDAGDIYTSPSLDVRGAWCLLPGTGRAYPA
jgi:hypothetical protein